MDAPNVAEGAWHDFLAGIEAAAETLEERPSVLLYTRRSARRLFNEFNKVQVELHHLSVDLRRLRTLWGRKASGA